MLQWLQVNLFSEIIFIKVSLEWYLYVCYLHVFSNCPFEHKHNHSDHIYKVFLQYEFVCAFADLLPNEIVCRSIHKHVVLYHCDVAHADLKRLQKSFSRKFGPERFRISYRLEVLVKLTEKNTVLESWIL